MNHQSGGGGGGGGVPIIANVFVVTIAFSSIMVAIWGNQPFWQHEGNVQVITNPKKITGIKLGTIFMIAGFVWIIVTMFILTNIDAILEWIPS